MQINENLRYNKYGLVFKILHDRYNTFSYNQLMLKGHAKLRSIYKTNANRAIEDMQDEELNLQD